MHPSGGVIPLSLLEESGFEQADPRAPDPVAAAIGEEILDRLGGEDESLRKIGMLMRDGFSLRALAAALGRPVWEIERQLERIRAILGPHWYDSG